MKNNILIIVLVTVVALGVITTVILASVINSDDPQSKGSHSSQSSSSYSQDVTHGGTESDFPESTPQNSGVSGGDPSGSSNVEGIIATANSLIGVEFLENGASPDGFDNSGFIYYVLRENGYITCPRGLDGQTKMGARLEFSELKTGDLVFFCNEPGEDAAGFGGIFIGGGKMIACLMPGTDVREVDISNGYYSARFFCGVSLS